MQSQIFLSSQQSLKSAKCDTLEKVNFSSVVAVMDNMFDMVRQSNKTILYVLKKP